MERCSEKEQYFTRYHDMKSVVSLAKLKFIDWEKYYTIFIYLFFRFYLFIYLFLGKGERVGKREGGKHQCVVASCMPPTGDPACNPGMCPDWESNRQPFGSQASTQSTEPHQPGLSIFK